MDIVWKNMAARQHPHSGRAAGLSAALRKVIAFSARARTVLFALIDECPHRKGPLSEGMISGDAVTCPLHNWCSI